MWLPVVMYNVETLTEGIKKGHKECGLLLLASLSPAALLRMGDLVIH